MQLNLVQMLDAKHDAHVHYEVIREKLPELCAGTDADPEKLENFITGRLNNSALDGAVAALSAKAGGLFLFAHLLGEHLESQAAEGKEIALADLDSLPAGLGEVYQVNFLRAFPRGKDDPLWAVARPLVACIAAAMEPLELLQVSRDSDH